MKNFAMIYHDAGISILPVDVGTKAPTSKTWKDRQQVIPAPEVIEKDFSHNGRGVGMICGEVSGKPHHKIGIYKQIIPKLFGVDPPDS